VNQITDDIFPYALLVLLVLVMTLFALPEVRGQQLDRVIVEAVTDRGGRTYSLPPFRGPIGARDFFNYYDGSPNTGLEEEGSFVVIPYRLPSGKTSLIITVGDPGSPDGGEANLQIKGLSQDSHVTLFDGAPVNYGFSPPDSHFHWEWDPAGADGVVIAGLTDSFELEIDFQPAENVNGVTVVSGSIASPEKLKLNPSAKVLLSGVARNREPEARFTCQQVVRKGEAVKFDASPSKNRENRITQYSWDFDGDGSYSFVSQNPTATHTFTETGIHQVNLRITTVFGNRALRSKTVKVTGAPIKATRHLSTNDVLPGKGVNVKIRILAREELSGIGLEENLPQGWEVRFQETEDVTWKPSTNQWLLKRKIEPGERTQISYTLLSPSRKNGINPGKTIKISGKVSSASPEFSRVVSGDSRLSVTSSVNPLTTLAHYDPENHRVDFELGGIISNSQLNAALQAWKLGKKLPPIDGREVDFELIKKVVLYHQKGAEVSEKISRPDAPEVEVTRSIDTGLPDDLILLHPDNPWSDRKSESTEFHVTVKISPGNRTLMGLGLDEQLPESWKVVPERKEDIVFKPDTARWIVKRPIFPGENFTISYRVKVPLKFGTEEALLEGELEESWSDKTISLRGDGSTETVTELPPRVVISRWNVEAGKLDLGMDNYISSSQSEKAISLWVKGLDVPFTGGEKISFSTVREIMALHLKGEPI